MKANLQCDCHKCTTQTFKAIYVHRFITIHPCFILPLLCQNSILSYVIDMYHRINIITLLLYKRNNGSLNSDRSLAIQAHICISKGP